MNFVRSIHEFCFGPVPQKRLRLWLRWFTISFIIYISARLEYAREWLTDFGFHLSRDALYSPDLLYMPTLPDWSLIWLISAFYVVSFALLWKPENPLLRWLILGFALYFQGVDTLSAFTLNKLYIISYFIYALPVSSERDAEGQVVVSAWPLRVLQTMLLCMYFTAGSCKVLHGTWLKEPDVLWTQVQGVYRTELAAWLIRTLPKWCWQIQMNLALSFELLAPWLLGLRKFRSVGILMGIGFHAVIALTMHELIYFSFQMITFYLLFEDPRKKA